MVRPAPSDLHAAIGTHPGNRRCCRCALGTLGTLYYKVPGAHVAGPISFRRNCPGGRPLLFRCCRDLGVPSSRWIFAGELRAYRGVVSQIRASWISPGFWWRPRLWRPWAATQMGGRTPPLRVAPGTPATPARVPRRATARRARQSPRSPTAAVRRVARRRAKQRPRIQMRARRWEPTPGIHDRAPTVTAATRRSRRASRARCVRSPVRPTARLEVGSIARRRAATIRRVHPRSPVPHRRRVLAGPVPCSATAMSVQTG